VFEIEAVDLLDVTQVVVGHNDSEPGRGWFLHAVTVSVIDADSPSRTWLFPCHRCVICSFCLLQL